MPSNVVVDNIVDDKIPAVMEVVEPATLYPITPPTRSINEYTKLMYFAGPVHIFFRNLNNSLTGR